MAPRNLLTMSASELDKLTVIERVVEGRLTQVEAGKQLGITSRHLRRLIRSYRSDSAQALVSKKRGKRSNRAYADAVKTRVVELVRERYVDFGPTLMGSDNQWNDYEKLSIIVRMIAKPLICRFLRGRLGVGPIIQEQDFCYGVPRSRGHRKPVAFL